MCVHLLCKGHLTSNLIPSINARDFVVRLPAVLRRRRLTTKMDPFAGTFFDCLICFDRRAKVRAVLFKCGTKNTLEDRHRSHANDGPAASANERTSL